MNKNKIVTEKINYAKKATGLQLKTPLGKNKKKMDCKNRKNRKPSSPLGQRIGIALLRTLMWLKFEETSGLNCPRPGALIVFFLCLSSFKFLNTHTHKINDDKIFHIFFPPLVISILPLPSNHFVHVLILPG